MRKHFTPSMVVALIALFVALGGTAVAAAVPLAKRALVADNAKKLGGRTPAQFTAAANAAATSAASAAASQPGPASTAASLVSVKTASFSLAASGEQGFGATCDAGQKAISGGYTSGGAVLAFDSVPTSDGTGWQVYLVNVSTSQPATGTVIAVCLR